MAVNKILHFFNRLFHFNDECPKDEVILRMAKKMDELGGLQFAIAVKEDGWIAECKNLQGIITCGSNPHISMPEIDSEIKDAIFSAFGVPPYLCDEEMISGPLDLDATSTIGTIEQLALIYRSHIIRFAH